MRGSLNEGESGYLSNNFPSRDALADQHGLLVGRIDEIVYANVIENWNLNEKLIAQGKGSEKAMPIVLFLLLAQLRHSQYSGYSAHSDC